MSVGRERRRKHRDDNNDRGLKLDPPEFKGSLVTKEYVDWISEIERIFEYKQYSEHKKFKVAVLKFKKYATLWLNNVKEEREREGKNEIRERGKLKRVMDKWFFSREYKQELYQKLQDLRQGKMAVNEYTREFENLKIRCDIPEAKEHTIARYLSDMNKEISNVVELRQYKTLDDVCKLALKVEKQKAKDKYSANKPYRGGFNTKEDVGYSKDEGKKPFTPNSTH